MKIWVPRRREREREAALDMGVAVKEPGFQRVLQGRVRFWILASLHPSLHSGMNPASQPAMH